MNYTENYRLELDNKLWAYKDKLLSDKRVGESKLEVLLNNAYRLSEYCIARAEIPSDKYQRVADMIRYVHTNYLEGIIKYIAKTDVEAKEVGEYVKEYKFFNICADKYEDYYLIWFGGLEDEH